MKHMKKIASLLLVLTLLLSLCVGAYADGEDEGATTAPATSGVNDNSGKITIDNAVVGQTYTIYQILSLESYNTETNAYSYKATSAWETWLKTQTTYVSIDTQDYVTWVEGADAAEFAKLAQAHAATLSDNQGSKNAESTTVEFTGLNLGYYLVDTTLGTLCSLDTTEPEVVIKEKNSVPTIEKKVKEGESWVDENTAKIGDTVEFKTTVHAKKGAQGYVIHDQMSEGLTLNQDSIEIKVGETTLTKDTDYTVSFSNNDNCTFEITFKQTYLDTLTADTDIVVTYSAVLNDKAVISDDANTNKTKLDYGEESKFETAWDETKTYTFMFDIVKTDSNKKLLSGAKFELYDAQTDGNKIALVKESEGVYRVATTAEASAEGFTSAVIEAGKATVKGLDGNTTYWLEEIEAPAGFNKLARRVEVKIETSNLTTSMTGDTWADGNGGVQITNQAGTELPSTGGMGTTLFYVVGAVLVLAAAVLLITKKRMKANG